jgi:hypothetical protein
LCFFVFTACIGVGETEVESKAIELGDVERADVVLDIGSGELEVHGGARELLEATFTYNVESWKPRIAYDSSSRKGILKIRQGKTDGVYTNHAFGESDIAITIQIDAGIGSIDLKTKSYDSV